MLPDAIQGETGRSFPITWAEIGDISSAVITGIIESIPGPSYTSREISGALVVTDGPNSVFTWTIDETDTEIADDFTVEFTATTGSVIVKSYPEPWRVVRARTPVEP